jgi:hypothetical protein
MNLKQLLRNIREESGRVKRPRGRKLSVEKVFDKVKEAAKKQAAGETSDEKPKSGEEAANFLKLPGPAKTSR